MRDLHAPVFSFLVSYCEFLYLCSPGIFDYSFVEFLIVAIVMSGIGIRIILVSYEGFGNSPSASIFYFNYLKKILALHLL